MLRYNALMSRYNALEANITMQVNELLPLMREKVILGLIHKKEQEYEKEQEYKRFNQIHKQYTRTWEGSTESARARRAKKTWDNMSPELKHIY